jgi:uncharacterized RDD family membrane protein YckC
MSQQADHPSHDDHNEVTIETLKTPPLWIQPAPIRKRIIAGLIDSLIAGVAWVSLVLCLHQKFAGPLVVSAEYIAVTFLYYVLQESMFASTIGKHFLGLRIVGNGGDPVSIREALIRNLVRVVDWLPLLYLFGALAVIISSKKQRLGDIAAGTVVTLVPERDINPPPAPFLFH